MIKVVECPNCSRKLHAAAHAIGKEAVCGACQAHFMVMEQPVKSAPPRVPPVDAVRQKPVQPACRPPGRNDRLQTRAVFDRVLTAEDKVRFLELAMQLGVGLKIN